MKITGSRVHRVWKCPASAVLRQFADLDEERNAPARGKGKAIHTFLQHVGRSEPAALIANAEPAYAALFSALDIADLPVGLAAEVSYAWNWRTGSARELGRDLSLRVDGGVDYDHPLIQPPIDWDSEIPCTLDVVGVAMFGSHGADPGRRGYVGDYKSGHAKYPPPDMFGQTLLGACCVASVHGCDDVVVELLHIHDDGGHHRVRRTVNAFDLEAFAAELYEAMERAQTAEFEGWPNAYEDAPQPREGLWCDYCPVYRGCPAKLALVRSMPEKLVQLGVRRAEPGGQLEIDPQALTVSNAAAAWQTIEAIEDVLGRAKAELCKLAWHESIPLADGRVLGRLVTEKRKVNGKLAAELLEKRYGRAERDLRVEVSVTLSALKQAVVAHIQPGQKIETRKGDGVLDRLLDALENEGGLTTTISEAVRSHVPKR